jgi:rhodanese-related sulfurtransferase
MSTPLSVRRTIADVLAEARSRLDRVSPAEARAEQQAGAVLVDIRPQVNIVTEGSIPGAFVIERNVLEWRFDPSSDASLAFASYELRVIVFCNEGYTSTLAAAALQDLGISRATDLIGGFRGWQAAGLRTVPPPRRAST